MRADYTATDVEPARSPTGRVTFDMRLLESFAVLADELHFGRAAKRLSFAQPALSQQIRRLEAQVGAVLFVRNSRTVELTAAGVAFRQHARASLAAAQDARAAVQAADRASASAFPLVLAGSSLPHTKALLRRFAAAQPHVRLEISSDSDAGAVEALRHHRADAAVLCSDEGPPAAYDTTAVLLASPGIGIAVHESHRFAALGEVSLQALSGERLAMFARAAAPEVHDRQLAALGGAERFAAVDDVLTFGPDLQQEMMFALAEGSIAPSTTWTADHRTPDDVVFVALRPPVAFTLWLVWEGTATPPTQALADLATQQLTAPPSLSLVKA